MSFVLDTNVFILLFNGRLAENLPEGDFVCSIVTEIELLSFPRLTAAEEGLIRAHLAEIRVHPVDSDVKETTIRLRRAHRLKLPDAIIAATAMNAGAVLLTQDEQLHGITGLECRKLAVK